MSFLLDTNVVSELAKDDPDINVFDWMSRIDEFSTWISVVTIAELRSGCEQLPQGGRRQRIELWLDVDVRARFSGRVLGIDEEAAEVCGRLIARGRRSGRTIGAMDTWIAAISRQHDLTVVTRNTRDFEALGVPLLNPWLEER